MAETKAGSTHGNASIAPLGCGQVRNHELQEGKEHDQAGYFAKADKGYPSIICTFMGVGRAFRLPLLLFPSRELENLRLFDPRASIPRFAHTRATRLT